MKSDNILHALTPAQKAAIEKAIEVISKNLPHKATLSTSEKDNMPTIGPARYPYAVKGIKDLAPHWVKKMAPDISAMLPEATLSLKLVDDYRPIISQLNTLLEYFTDGQHIAGAQAFAFLRAFYGEGQSMKERGVAGADSLVDELAPLFAGQGNSK